MVQANVLGMKQRQRHGSGQPSHDLINPGPFAFMEEVFSQFVEALARNWNGSARAANYTNRKNGPICYAAPNWRREWQTTH